MKNRPVCGMHGICMDLSEDDRNFAHLIADNDIPWQKIPEGCVAVEKI